MVTWMGNNLGIILMVLGIILLAIEMLVYGFTAYYFFFLCLAFLMTGLLMFLGLLVLPG